MSDHLDKLVRRLSGLPDADLMRLAAAARAGAPALSRLRAGAGSNSVRAACSEIAAASTDRSHLEVAGIIEGLRRVRSRDHPRIDVVWSGPSSHVTTHRLTSSTVADLIDEAEHSIVLVSYAMHSEKTVGSALERAARRFVAITLLAERHVDNPSFTGGPAAFADLPAARLAWPASCREPGASLHAKILAIDTATVLIGSANLTQSAMERNLECGIVVRDRSTARAIEEHVRGLEERGVLVRV